MRSRVNLVITGLVFAVAMLIFQACPSGGGNTNGNSNGNYNYNYNYNTNTNYNSNTNTNDNSNSNTGVFNTGAAPSGNVNSNTNSSGVSSPSVVDPTKEDVKAVPAKGAALICSTYADKLKATCAASRTPMTEWHKTALTAPQTFLRTCSMQPIFKNIRNLSALQSKVNSATTCVELTAIEFD